MINYSLINLYWHVHALGKRFKNCLNEVHQFTSPDLLPGDKLLSIKPNPPPPPALSLRFPPPPMSSIWRGCREWRALQSPWQTWASEAGTCQGYFYCRCPWGFTKLFCALCLSSLSFSLLLVSETSMTLMWMHLRKLHSHCFCMTLL